MLMNVVIHILEFLRGGKALWLNITVYFGLKFDCFKRKVAMLIPLFKGVKNEDVEMFLRNYKEKDKYWKLNNREVGFIFTKIPWG